MIDLPYRSDECDAGLCGYCALRAFTGGPCQCRCHPADRGE
jgi:hypothetical protein